MTTHQALDGRLHPNIDSGLFLINHLRSTNHTDVQISKARHLVVHSGLVAELTFVRTEKKTWSFCWKTSFAHFLGISDISKKLRRKKCSKTWPQMVCWKIDEGDSGYIHPLHPVPEDQWFGRSTRANASCGVLGACRGSSHHCQWRYDWFSNIPTVRTMGGTATNWTLPALHSMWGVNLE